MMPSLPVEPVQEADRMWGVESARMEAAMVETELRATGFCDECVAATTPKSAGGTSTVNGIGDMLYGASQRCADCGSVVKLKAWCVFFLPIFPRGYYRVIWLPEGGWGRSRYLSRKCISQSPTLPPKPADPQDTAPRAGRWPRG